MRTAAAFLLGVLVMAACGSKASSIAEYILDVKNAKLRATDPAKDLPLSFCETETCYVYRDGDVKSIKKYIVSLEEKLKECQKQ